MIQEMTLTTLQQTVNLIGGLYGMAAVTRFAFGRGLDSRAWAISSRNPQGVTRFASDLSIDGRDLSCIGDSMSGLKSVGLPQGTMPKQRSGKCSFRFSVLTSD